jgi:hypothetical protein
MFECDDGIIANVPEENLKMTCAFSTGFLGEFLGNSSEFLENGVLT